MLNLMNFQLDTDIKNVISKKLKNYPLDKNMDNLTISTWKKNILPKTDGHKYYLSCLKDNDVVFAQAQLVQEKRI